MPKFKLEIEDFCEGIFQELGAISTGRDVNECEFAADEGCGTMILIDKLTPFIKEKLGEAKDE